MAWKKNATSTYIKFKLYSWLKHTTSQHIMTVQLGATQVGSGSLTYDTG